MFAYPDEDKRERLRACGCGRGTAGPASLAKLLLDEVGGAELQREVQFFDAAASTGWCRPVDLIRDYAYMGARKLRIPGLGRENVMERFMITDRVMINRRTAIGGALAALSPLVFPGRAMAQGKAVPSDTFVLLLKGLYQPVVHGPNLGLSVVDLNDGSYSTTKIYPVSGIPGNTNPNKAIGNFYVQLNGDLCAYHVPGGSFAMRFISSDLVPVDDGNGGNFLEGTEELTILEATGIYRSFVGGHNHMVDKLHFLPPGDGSGGIDEYCFCNISSP